MLRLDYPHAWPDFFQQLFRLLTDGAGVSSSGGGGGGGGGAVLTLGVEHIQRIDLLLRMFVAIDSEIVARRDSDRARHDVARTAAIKDAMRVDCVPTIVDICFGVVQAYSAPAAQTWPAAEALVNAALNVLQVTTRDVPVAVLPHWSVRRDVVVCFV